MLAWPAIGLAQPAITSARILTPIVNVFRPRASPLIEFNVTGDGSIIQYTLQGPSGELFYQGFSAPSFPKKVLLQGYNPTVNPAIGNATEFTPYTEAGTWKVWSLQICDAQFSCGYYDQAQIAALFPSTSFTVVNPGKIDILPPYATSGTILTPSLSISKADTLRILLKLEDNVSGVASASVCAATPGITKEICAVIPPPLRLQTAGAYLATAQLPTGTPPGTYTINDVFLADIAGNTISLSNPGQLNGIFGTTTFTVTP